MTTVLWVIPLILFLIYETSYNDTRSSKINTFYYIYGNEDAILKITNVFKNSEISITNTFRTLFSQ